MRDGDRRRDIIFAHYDGVRWSDMNVNRVAGFLMHYDDGRAYSARVILY